MAVLKRPPPPSIASVGSNSLPGFAQLRMSSPPLSNVQHVAAPRTHAIATIVIGPATGADSWHKDPAAWMEQELRNLGVVALHAPGVLKNVDRVWPVPAALRAVWLLEFFREADLRNMMFRWQFIWTPALEQEFGLREVDAFTPPVGLSEAVQQQRTMACSEFQQQQRAQQRQRQHPSPEAAAPLPHRLPAPVVAAAAAVAAQPGGMSVPPRLPASHWMLDALIMEPRQTIEIDCTPPEDSCSAAAAEAAPAAAALTSRTSSRTFASAFAAAAPPIQANQDGQPLRRL